MSWIAAAVFACAPAHGTTPPEELGRVPWARGFEAALVSAEAQHKPLLVLFDEVPGCATVKAYGRGALSDPLVVDAAQTLFVPVVVYNNVEGPDRDALERYGEPAWNNPVVRIVGPDGADLVPRLTGDWSTGALLQRMADGLEAAGATVPEWLALVVREHTLEHPRTSTYAMGCFWSGEAHLGAAAGVVGTRTGFQAGQEVVEVTWDPEATDGDALDAFAQAGRSAPATPGGFRASPHDDRYRLRGTPWAGVPMTEAQASRVNADVAAGRDAERWLSPSQLAILAEARSLGGGWNAGLGQIPLAEGFDRALAAIERRR